MHIAYHLHEAADIAKSDHSLYVLLSSTTIDVGIGMTRAFFQTRGNDEDIKI